MSLELQTLPVSFSHLAPCFHHSNRAAAKLLLYIVTLLLYKKTQQTDAMVITTRIVVVFIVRIDNNAILGNSEMKGRLLMLNKLILQLLWLH